MGRGGREKKETNVILGGCGTSVVCAGEWTGICVCYLMW